MKTMDVMRKFFTNDTVFKICFFLGVIFQACYLTFQNISAFVNSGEVELRLTGFFCLACLIVVFISYWKHAKNLMKNMLGATLAMLYSMANFNPAGAEWKIETAFRFISMILSLALFVNHFIINSDRHSSPVHININQWLLFFLTLNTVAWSVYMAFFNTALGVTGSVFEIVNMIGYVGFYGTIVCVESRLDAYRIDREKAGWTEEAGYPKDYVHAYQKK